jgi:hypothetical protein
LGGKSQFRALKGYQYGIFLNWVLLEKPTKAILHHYRSERKVPTNPSSLIGQRTISARDLERGIEINLFGYLGELKKISLFTSVFGGFVPFFMMFYIIYENFAKYTDLGTSLFWYFVIVWGLYGVAACLSYKLKNTSYNILDLFAKNFFGLFLAYLLYSNYTK